jgi:hypothetical protein
MGHGSGAIKKLVGRGDTTDKGGLPTPSMSFRRKAWLEFQRALDPLAPPKPLPTKRLR